MNAPQRRFGRVTKGAWPPGRWLAFAAALLVWGGTAERAAAQPRLGAPIEEVLPRIVKIYGAGGFRGLEPYQSGFLVSPEGHVLTVFSYVIDTDVITVTLDDGRKYEATLLGADPRLELAVLKINAKDLPFFDLAEAAVAEAGTRILAFSNLYGIATGNEPASVLQGTVSVKARLEARHGVFTTQYRGQAYILDAITNNPGAAGGALTDRRGRLLGMLGKELRNSLSNTWLNYAVPAAELLPSVNAIKEGKTLSLPPEESIRPENPLSLRLLGIALIPDVLERTPPFVDVVRPNSPAAQAGLRPDDLVMFIGGRLIQSCRALEEEIGRMEREDEVRLTVIRDNELRDITLKAAGNE